MPEENKSMMLAIIAAVLIIAVGIVIFIVASNNYNSATNTTTNNPVSNPSTSGSESFDLSAQNNSGQTGKVTLIANGDSTKVTIVLANPSSTSEPAHIHLGKCPTPGAVKYPLSNVINGMSVTNINVKLSDLKTMGDLAVNVHKSADESTVYVSCGDLAF